MNRDFWMQRWEKDEIGFHLSDVNDLLVQYWPTLSVTEGSCVFIPLCGKSKDIMWLREKGYQVVGVELSKKAASAFFDEQDLSPTISQDGPFEVYEVDGIRIYAGDFFDLTTAQLECVVAVYDRASMIALPAEMRRDYVAHLSSLLAVDVHVLLVTLEYPQAEMAGPPFAVSRDEIESLYLPYATLDCLHEADVLKESPGFQQRGLSYLHEKVYHLHFNRTTA